MNNSKLLDHLQNKLGLDIRYLIKNSTVVFIKYSTISLISFIMSIFFARYLSKEMYGQYQSIFGLLSILSILSFPGLNSLALREVSRNNPKASLHVIKKSVILSIISLPIFFIVVSLFAPNQLVSTFYLAALLFPFYYGLNTWYTYYEGSSDFLNSSARIVLLNILIGVSIVILIINNQSLTQLILIPMLLSSVIQLIYVLEIKKKITQKIKLIPFSYKFGYFSTLQKASVLINENLFSFIIPFVYSFQDLAEYYIALTITNIFIGVINSLLVIYTPLLFKYKSFYFKKIIIQSAIIGVALIVLAKISTKYLFLFFYGEKYSQSIYYLNYLLWILPVIPLKIFLTNYLSSKEKNSEISIVNILSILLASSIFVLQKNISFSINIVNFYFINQIFTFVSLLVLFYLTASQKISSIRFDNFRQSNLDS